MLSGPGLLSRTILGEISDTTNAVRGELPGLEVLDGVVAVLADANKPSPYSRLLS